jgi:hypothetical protein
MDVATAIERAGGFETFADSLGLDRTTVWRWQAANALPGSAKLERLRAALAKAAKVPESRIKTH